MRKLSRLFKTTALFLSLVITATTLSSCSLFKKSDVKSPLAEYDYSNMDLVQLDSGRLLNGEFPIAVITTSLGVIKIALFPEYAPNTVQNFIDRINEGFYDNTTVLGVQKGVFLQAGTNSNKETKTTSGDLIENEYSVNIWPFKGAIGGYSAEQGVSDSRFFIINEDPLSAEQLTKLREITIPKPTSGEISDEIFDEGATENSGGDDTENNSETSTEEERVQMFPDELLSAFEQVGCAVTMSGFFTFFGQTVEGVEIIEAICKAEVDKKGVPHILGEEIKILKIELEQ